MATLAPLLATDIPTILAGEPLIDPIALAAVLDPLDPCPAAVLEISPPPSLLPPARQVARDAKAVANTQVDWRETSAAHIFKVDLPGVKKEEIRLQIVAGSTLEICGERKREEVQKTDKWHLVERASGSFLRRFRLPENANSEDVKAHVEDGVLTVTISKHQKPEPQILRIPVT